MEIMIQKKARLVNDVRNTSGSSVGNSIRGIFVKTKLHPLSPPNFTIKTQACVYYIQVSYGSKAEDINGIEHRTVAPIEVQETRTDDPMVVIQEKGIKKTSMNLVLRGAAYDTTRILTVIPIQETKK